MTAARLNHVMYVDDEPDMRMLFQGIVESTTGIRVTLCESGRDAVGMAIAQKPQMIILDVMMDDKDGPAILKEIREDSRLAGIPVIFLTAKTDEEEIELLKKSGAKGVLKKPFDIMTIAGQVQELWDKSHD